MLFVNYVLKGKERIDYLDKKLENYTLSDLRLETKGFQFESACQLCGEMNSLQ